MPKANKFTESEKRHFSWREFDFCWLVEHLLPPNQKVLGCHIKIPDMAFFKSGKIVLRVRTDSKGILVSIRNSQKLKKTEIRNDFPGIVRERRKRHINAEDIENILAEEQVIRASGNNSKEVHKDENGINFSKSDAYQEFNLPPGKTLHGNYYRDLVLVREYPNSLNEEGK